MARAGRRPGPTRTKDEILACARGQFAEHGYNATTVRSIAAAAAVNPALIHHYFGSKDRLFLAVLSLPINPAVEIAHLLDSGSADDFPDRLVRYFITAWRDPIVGQGLHAVLRRAVSEQESAALLRNFAENLILPQVAAALRVPELRVAAALSHLFGLLLGATILRIEPLASAADDELAALVAPAIRHYLTSTLPVEGRIRHDV